MCDYFFLWSSQIKFYEVHKLSSIKTKINGKKKSANKNFGIEKVNETRNEISKPETKSQ